MFVIISLEIFLKSLKLCKNVAVIIDVFFIRLVQKKKIQKETRKTKRECWTVAPSD